MEAPAGTARVGMEFHSTGSDGKKRVNHDRSVVTEATPSAVFEFVTESRCERAGRTLASAGTFVHRYGITPGPGGCRVAYTMETTRFEGGPAVLRVPMISSLLAKVLTTMFPEGVPEPAAVGRGARRRAYGRLKGGTCTVGGAERVHGGAGGQGVQRAGPRFPGRDRRPWRGPASAVVYRLGSVAFQVGAFPFGAALLAMAVAGLRSRALPAWLSWVSAALGVIALILRAVPEETYGPERVGSVAFFTRCGSSWWGWCWRRRTARTEEMVSVSA